jgi:hypothetical protein
MAAAGLAGELCVGKAENYVNSMKISIAYVVSQVIYSLHGFFFILFLGVDGLVKTFPNLFTKEAAQMVENTFFNGKNMAIILAIEIAAAVLGTLFGKYVYKKFFDKTDKKRSVLS